MIRDLGYVTEGHAEFVRKLFPADFKGVCIDIGAHDPLWINNTWIFEQEGWDTYCIEPNPNCIPKLKQYRKNVIQYAVSNENKEDVDFYIYTIPNDYAGTWGQASESGLIDKEFMNKDFLTKIKVSTRTFEWLMENEIKQDHIDVLSIDVEGAEMFVLSTLDTVRWKPTVVIIENFHQTPDQHEWFASHGFTLIRRIHLNDIYVANEKMEECLRSFQLSI